MARPALKTPESTKSNWRYTISLDERTAKTIDEIKRTVPEAETGISAAVRFLARRYARAIRRRKDVTP